MAKTPSQPASPDRTEGAKPEQPPAKAGKPPKRARLDAALRENLKRRKAAQRKDQE
ncbi:MAG: hypothetical protein AAFR41_01125 [Pseudomonadota bacterium]